MKGKNFDKKIMSGFKKPKMSLNIHKKQTINKPIGLMRMNKSPVKTLMPRNKVPIKSMMPIRPITPVQKINSKLMGDYDRDGVRNVIDCQPMNRFKQEPKENSVYESDNYNILVPITEQNKDDIVRVWGFDGWADWEKYHDKSENPVGMLMHISQDDEPYYSKYKNQALSVNQINTTNRLVAFIMGGPYEREQLYPISAKQYRDGDYQA